jgi:hypothetical protein
MAIDNGTIESKTSSVAAVKVTEDGSKTLALYTVGLALTLLLNWYVQPYTLFWG